MKKVTERLNLHDGNTPYNPPEFYNFHDGKIFTGLTVVSWNLTDTGPDLGGLYIILGSHKLNIPCPDIIKKEHEYVLVPEIEAGSVVIFNEALTHGTSEWKDTFKRRLLLFKYSLPLNNPGVEIIQKYLQIKICLQKDKKCCLNDHIFQIEIHFDYGTIK